MYLLALALIATDIVVPATDDVWAYQHAPNSASDPFLRCWGDGASAIGGTADSSTSWSAIRFELPKSPKGELTGATLVLWHVGDSAISQSDAKSSPLEVRAIGASFDEGRWSFDDARGLEPEGGKDGLYASVVPEFPSNAQPFEMRIDLLKGPAKFVEALAGDSVAIAITSTLDPAEAGDGAIYKFYSRNAEEQYRPKLILTYSSP